MRSARASWLLIGMALAAPVYADDAPSAVKNEIVALTQALMDAIGYGNKEIWQRTALDDALITDEFGRRQTRQELIDSLRPFAPGLSGNIEVRDAHVRTYGDTALIDFEDYETETVFGQKLLVRYLSSATYVRRDGAWKLAGMIDLTLPTPPPPLAVRDLKLEDYAGVYRYAPERAFFVAIESGRLVFRTRPAAAKSVALDPLAKDVFMGGDEEKNIFIFRRNESGKITELIERRKFNDLHLKRDGK